MDLKIFLPTPSGIIITGTKIHWTADLIFSKLSN